MGKVKYETAQNIKQALGVKVTEKNSCILCAIETHIQQYNIQRNPSCLFLLFQTGVYLQFNRLVEHTAYLCSSTLINVRVHTIKDVNLLCLQ